MTTNLEPAAQAYVWQALDAPDDAMPAYVHPDYVPAHLIARIARPPRLVLDVGCYAGATGAYVKARHPDARVIGIEPRAAAAARAARRLDAVQATTLEGFDFDAAGIAPGTVDTVILADVLEHMYNPWAALVGLRRWLSPDAQLLVSMPNARNLWLLDRLAIGGEWRYEAQGLLDVTHIRFFTRRDMMRLFAETGYRVGEVHCNIDERCRGVLSLPMNGPTVDLQTPRLTLKGLTRDDLAELATLQFFFVATPAGDTP